MKKNLLPLLVLLTMASCKNGADYTAEHFRLSYDELRKQYPQEVIIQDKIIFDTFWIIGDDFIEYDQFDYDDPKKIIHTHTINGIETDEDYHIPLNSTLYSDPMYDNNRTDSIK